VGEQKLNKELSQLIEGSVPSVVARALNPKDIQTLERATDESGAASTLIYEALRSGQSLPQKYKLNKFEMGHPGPLGRSFSTARSSRTAENFPATYAGFALSDLAKGTNLLREFPGESLRQTEKIFEAAAPLLKYKARSPEDQQIAEALAGKLQEWRHASDAVKATGALNAPTKKRMIENPQRAKMLNQAYSKLMSSRAALLRAVETAAATPIGRGLGQEKTILQALKHNPMKISPMVDRALGLKFGSKQELLQFADDLINKLKTGDLSEDDWIHFIQGLSEGDYKAVHDAGLGLSFL